MNRLPGSENLQSSKEKLPTTVIKDVRQAVGLVTDSLGGKEGVKPVQALWVDTYMDQIRPNYLIIHDPNDAQRFNQIVTALKGKDRPNDPGERMALFDELNQLAGTDVETGSLKWVFQAGEWRIPPEVLIEDAESLILQEADEDWFAEEREYFARHEEEEDLIKKPY